MINFAHRGASGDYPENTILAFKKAIELKADGIEIDVHKTKDNKIVVIHDEDIERTFKGKGLIKDYTLDELKKFKTRKIEFETEEFCEIPTLQDVFELLKETNLILNIELKNDEIEYEDLEQDVIKMIKEYNFEKQTIISSFNHASILKCKNIDINIKAALLYGDIIENVVEYSKEFKADALHPDLRLVSKELVEEAHANNIQVNVYTVNRPSYMRLLIDANVDGIITDYPALLKEVIQC